jgi:hypothetical protein
LRPAVESERILLQYPLLRRLADIVALQQHPRNKPLATAVRHVGAEDDLPLADEIDHLGERRIFDFRAEV